MGQWMMFNWTYSRKPKTTLFEGGLTKVLVSRSEDQEGKVSVEETVLMSLPFETVAMAEMLAALHNHMKEEKLPCKVTVFLPSKAENSPVPKVWELDEPTVELIKTDLPKALQMWSPWEVVCDVRPYVPTLRQEKENGTNS